MPRSDLPQQIDLSKLFQGTEDIKREPEEDKGNPTWGTPAQDLSHAAGPHERDIPAHWMTVCTLQLRGLTNIDIARTLQMNPASITHIARDPRYQTYRETRLVELDDEYSALKPLAIEALKRGLTSLDGNISLRASEQWFKGASYKGFGSGGDPSRPLSAEEVATRLLAMKLEQNVNVPVNVTVNLPGVNHVPDKDD